MYNSIIDSELLQILACPACRGPLAEKGGRLSCSTCSRVYPVRQGIPILLEEEALPIEKGLD